MGSQEEFLFIRGNEELIRKEAGLAIVIVESIAIAIVTRGPHPLCQKKNVFCEFLVLAIRFALLLLRA